MTEFDPLPPENPPDDAEPLQSPVHEPGQNRASPYPLPVSNALAGLEQVQGGLLPLARINGAVYPISNCLHFFPVRG